MPSQCVLIRHGETEWSKLGRHTGRTDLPLLPEGEAQALAAREKVASYSFSQVRVSPLLRARQTAALIGFGDDIMLDEDLLEWDYGEVEGRTTAEMRETHPGWTVIGDGAPGGETIDEVAVRVDRVIARVRESEGTVALVAHAHLLRILASRWLGFDPRAAAHLVLGPASVSLLGWERSVPAIIRWNQ